MTGFGSAEGPLGASRISVELRSVNHRFFNSTIRLPVEFSKWEHEVRELLKKQLPRGHVSLSARLDRAEGSLPTVNEARVAAYVDMLRALADRHALAGGVDLATVLRMPDVFSQDTEASPEDAGQLAAQLMDVVARAAASMVTARTEEGERLASYLRERLDSIAHEMASIADRAPVRVVEHRDRLHTAVGELLGDATVDEQRLALEIALLAERMDVEEEISRFGSHCTAFREAIDTNDAQPVGKRLGFLLQEMLREANTTGSKANDAAVTRAVLVIKEELERMREQVENLE
jgi:uncharacterized protein (TIGR00255 family)